MLILFWWCYLITWEFFWIQSYRQWHTQELHNTSTLGTRTELALTPSTKRWQCVLMFSALQKHSSKISKPGPKLLQNLFAFPHLQVEGITAVFGCCNCCGSCGLQFLIFRRLNLPFFNVSCWRWLLRILWWNWIASEPLGVGRLIILWNDIWYLLRVAGLLVVKQRT